jgi:YVTN family beta-propeller protein
MAAPWILLVLSALAVATTAENYTAPAGDRPALSRPGARSILPGGRIIDPLGHQHQTGPGPFGLAISPSGKLVVSADGGPRRYSITVLQRQRTRWRVHRHESSPAGTGHDTDEDDWRSVFMGLAFDREKDLYASEGNSGRVRLLHPVSGKTRRIYSLNQGSYTDSYSGDLALDRKRGLLYVVDQANFRVAIIDVRNGHVISSTRVGRLPFAITLSPDANKFYVTNFGMFEYHPIPGADPKRVRETGLKFPAFGFPSPEAMNGARRRTALGQVDVPALGNPNARESNSLCTVNVEDPKAPRIEAFIRTGTPFGRNSSGGSSPSGVIAAGDRIYVSNAHNDSITVIDARTGLILAEIPIRIPGLDHLRGVLPLGTAYHAPSGWLLVAEAGINAIGVIDTHSLRVLGHLPAGWFPTQVRTDRDNVYVTNAKGHGTGPNASRHGPYRQSFQGLRRRGTITIFPLPGKEELERHTARVLEMNGFVPVKEAVRLLPSGIRHVVLIVKENRTFDEVFGDIAEASNGPVEAAPELARFGRHGYIQQDRNTLRSRLSLREMNMTPNHHAMAARWAFSDNFYADSEVSVDGHHWLVGSYPNAWTETSLMASYGGQKDFRFPTTAPGRLQFAESRSSVHPEEQLEAGTIWHHLERHDIPFRNYGEGFELAGVNEGRGLKPTGARFLTNVPMPDPLFRNTSREYPQYNMNIPDQYRASQFIAEIERKYVKGGESFPRFLFLHLPNDHLAKPRPGDGYPFEASYMADNDFALGRIVEYLSHSPWWRQMAIFITEDDAQGGVDHIDSHRTVLLVVSPYARKNYVSHVNVSFPGLLKTIFRLLEIPPLNLFDAAASDLSDCFTEEADFTPYETLPVDPRIFDPGQAREPLDPQPSPGMDDPRVLQEQHER